MDEENCIRSRNDDEARIINDFVRNKSVLLTIDRLYYEWRIKMAKMKITDRLEILEKAMYQNQKQNESLTHQIHILQLEIQDIEQRMNHLIRADQIEYQEFIELHDLQHQVETVIDKIFKVFEKLSILKH